MGITHDWDRVIAIAKELAATARSWTDLATRLGPRVEGGRMPRQTLTQGIARELGRTFDSFRAFRDWALEGQEVLPPLTQALLDYLRRGERQDTPVSLVDLCERFDRGPSSIEQAVSELGEADYHIRVTDDRKVLMPAVIPPSQTRIPFGEWMRNRVHRFGVVSDTHLANRNSRLDVLECLYDWYAEEGIEVVLLAGNLVDGEFKYNQQELLAHGVEGQIAYAAENYPKREGIVTKFITADCFDDQTEVMTRTRGFVRFEDLLGCEEVATLNLDTEEWEWQAPTAHVRNWHDGDMYHFHSQKIDVMVTPGHCMLIKNRTRGEWDEVPAEDFERGNWQFRRGCKWQGEDATTITVPKVSTTHPWAVGNDSNMFPAVQFMRFMGWYLAEGSCSGTRVQVAQEETSAYYEEIVEVVESLGFRAARRRKGVEFSSIHLSAYVKSLGRSWEKYIPDELRGLAKGLLEELLLAYWRGDGTFGDGRAWRAAGFPLCASTASKQLASDITEVAMKCGYAAMFSEWDRIGRAADFGTHLGVHRHMQYNIGLSKNWYPHYRTVPDRVHYTGHTYCVRVPNGTILVRRNGRVGWHHNCHEGWWASRSGLDIGRHMHNTFRDLRREDLQWLGHVEVDLELHPDNPQAVLRVFHPGGGSAYAISYSPMKHVESWQGGNKPSVCIFGHYHKWGLFYPREVWCLLAGTTCDQTMFMRKKKLAAHVGGSILEIEMTALGGVGEVKAQFKPFYDKGYYESNWDYLSMWV